RLLAVARELAAHQVGGIHRPDVLEDLGLLVANRLVVGARGRLHREVAHYLQEMVLDDVAGDAGLFEELAPPLDAEVLRHRDLYVLDEVAVQDRLEKRVREPEVENVLNRPLAEIVIDPEDVALRKILVQDPVQLPRRREIAPERLLDDD